jgi:hypothetical protein
MESLTLKKCFWDEAMEASSASTLVHRSFDYLNVHKCCCLMQYEAEIS